LSKLQLANRQHLLQSAGAPLLHARNWNPILRHAARAPALTTLMLSQADEIADRTTDFALLGRAGKDQLTELHISNLESLDAKVVSSIMQSLPRLKILVLQKLELCDKSFEYLQVSQASCRQSLTQLDLRDNKKLSSEMLDRIAASFPRLTKLLLCSKDWCCKQATKT